MGLARCKFTHTRRRKKKHKRAHTHKNQIQLSYSNVFCRKSKSFCFICFIDGWHFSLPTFLRRSFGIFFFLHISFEICRRILIAIRRLVTWTGANENVSEKNEKAFHFISSIFVYIFLFAQNMRISFIVIL